MHHTFPNRVCYPLAFERSGYLHPAFDDFIDLYSRCSTSTQPQPHTALQLRFAVAFAITFTTASLLRAASLRLLPCSLFPFVPPKSIPVPACWAPSLFSSTFSRSAFPSTTPCLHSKSTLEYPAHTSLRASTRHGSLAPTAPPSCAPTCQGGGILGVRF